MIELLLVLAITGIISAATMAMFAAFNRSYRTQANLRRAHEVMAMAGNQIIETIAQAYGGFQGPTALVDTSNCGAPCRRMSFQRTVSYTAKEAGAIGWGAGAGTWHVITSNSAMTYGAITTGTGYWCLARTATASWGAAVCTLDATGNCTPPVAGADFFCRGNGAVGGGNIRSGTLQFRNIQFNCYNRDNSPVTCGAEYPKRVEVVVQARVCVQSGCSSAFVPLPLASPAGSGWMDQTWAGSQITMNDYQAPGGQYRRPF